MVVHRRLEWAETDAAGHHHFTVVMRWIEEAEHELYRALGVGAQMIDRVPRVHLEVDYSARIFYGEQVIVTVGVAKVGRSSCTFEFTVDRADGGRAASGNYTVVFVASTTDGAEPWPDQVRSALVSESQFTLSSSVTSTRRGAPTKDA